MICTICVEEAYFKPPQHGPGRWVKAFANQTQADDLSSIPTIHMIERDTNQFLQVTLCAI